MDSPTIRATTLENARLTLVALPRTARLTSYQHQQRWVAPDDHRSRARMRASLLDQLVVKKKENVAEFSNRACTPSYRVACRRERHRVAACSAASSSRNKLGHRGDSLPLRAEHAICRRRDSRSRASSCSAQVDDDVSKLFDSPASASAGDAASSACSAARASWSRSSRSTTLKTARSTTCSSGSPEGHPSRAGVLDPRSMVVARMHG